MLKTEPKVQNIAQFPNKKAHSCDHLAVEHFNPAVSQTACSENSLLSRIESLESFIQSSCDWTWQADSEMRITAVSQNVLTLYGVQQAYFIGKTHEELAVPAGAGNCWEDLDEKTGQTAPFRNIEYQLGIAGRGFRIRISGAPLKDDKGSVTGYHGTAVDISDIQKYRHAMDLANNRFVQAIDSFSGSFALFDENDRIVAFNETYRKLHWFLGDELKPGLAFERCIRIQIEKGIIRPEPGSEEQWIAQRLHRFHNPDGPFEIQKAENLWYRVTEQRFADGGCLKTMEDISAMKLVELELRSNEQRFRDFAEAAADWFFEFSPACKLTYLSESFDSLTGQVAADFVGKDHEAAFGGLFSQQTGRDFNRAIEQRYDCHELEMCFRFPDTAEQYFSISGRPSYDTDGSYAGFRGIAKNITETKILTDQLNRQASHDDLTGLANRRQFNRVLDQVYFDCITNLNSAVVAYVDLDQFKIVNDSEGHVTGDLLLKDIAERLSKSLDSNDLVARLGGDEFGLILTNVNLQEGMAKLEQVTNALRANSFTIEDRVYNVTASIGVVELDQYSPGIGELMKLIDIACYEAKEQGRNHIQIVSSKKESASSSGDLISASDIEQALANDRFTLYAQPIRRTAHAINKTISLSEYDHYELLVRMVSVDGSIIPPVRFISVAERFKLMTEIDKWVIRHSLQRLSQHVVAGKLSTFTINLSGQSLTDSTLVN